MREPAALASVLRTSGDLDDIKTIAQSWFEDDPQVAREVERGRGRAKLATYLLQSAIARHRDRWTEVVLRTALWMREAPPETDLSWRELTIVAKALADGKDMTEIGLMRDIAWRTIAALGDGERM
jgi:DNA-binding NarL/FixJ family response regulator